MGLVERVLAGGQHASGFARPSEGPHRRWSPAEADLEVIVVLAGARPEEIAQWRDGPVPPAAALSFAASARTSARWPKR